MKKVLLATTSMFGFGALAAPALAADGIKLSVGGFFKEAYMVVEDDNHEAGELGYNHNTDGFFNDAEVHFTGSTVLDNGLEVGARIELEGENDVDSEGGGDQIDEAWIYFAGGFGEVRIGSDDDALANSCIVPPGGTGNFSAFSPNQWGANTGPLTALSFFASNSICTGVDDESDAQKILYITPVFGGFQLTVSYTPDSDAETHNDGAGPHVGMPVHEFGNGRHNVSAYGTYTYEGDGWGVTAGLGGSWEGHAEDTDDPTDTNERDFYQAGLNLNIGNFAIGVAGEYYNDIFNDNFGGGESHELDIWVAGIGASYQMDAWTFGLQYSHREDDFNNTGSVQNFDLQQDRVVATVNYALGPGISVDGEVGYTWVDTDPGFEDVDLIVVNDQGDGLDDYDAIEFGVGTSITF